MEALKSQDFRNESTLSPVVAWYSKEKQKTKPVENAAKVLIGDSGPSQRTCAFLLEAVLKSFAAHKMYFSLDKAPFNGCRKMRLDQMYSSIKRLFPIFLGYFPEASFGFIEWMTFN